MEVKFNNLESLNNFYRVRYNWDKYLDELIGNSQYILGKKVADFENKYATFLNSKHCIGVASGLDALTISLKALKEKHPKIENIAVPAMTFFATIEAIVHAGLTPLLVDITPNGHIDWSKIPAEADAVVSVDLCGEINPIPSIGIPVIQDSCQSHGATLNGAKAGTQGIMGCFSFYPGKNFGALGDGGAICTNDSDLADIAKSIRNHGSKVKYEHDYFGYTSRLDTLQAMFLSDKLDYLDIENDKRRSRANGYVANLLDIRGLEFQSHAYNSSHNVHLMVIKTSSRDNLARYLKENGIETGVHYPGSLNNLKAFYSKFGFKGTFPEAEKWARMAISLPMHPGLTAEELWHVCSTIKEFFKK